MRRTGPDQQTRDVVMTRAKYCCERCWDPEGPWAIHHRRPRGMGGTRRADTNAVSSLVYLCEDCHRHVESHRAEALEQGWLVRQNADPAQVPLLIGQFTIYLTAHGTYAPSLDGVA